MFKQRIYLPPYRWIIIIFYNVLPEDVYEVTALMEHCGASDNVLIGAERNLMWENRGVTWSSEVRRTTIIAMSDTSSPGEFWNSFDHEKGHAATHIAIAMGLDPEGEERQYLSGEIARETYPFAKHLVCRDCIG